MCEIVSNIKKVSILLDDLISQSSTNDEKYEKSDGDLKQQVIGIYERDDEKGVIFR
jgi:hypothetical protein